MSGALYNPADNSVLFYSCKTGCTFLSKCPRCKRGRCSCVGPAVRFGEHLDFEVHDLENVELFRAVVRDPVERAISAFQHCILRLYFPDRREQFLRGDGGDSHWQFGELEHVQAWRTQHHAQLQRYLQGAHPDDIVALYEDFVDQLLPVLMQNNCHFMPQLNEWYVQQHLERAELWVTPKLTVEMQTHYPQVNWQRRSIHRGGWYFNISRKRFYDAIVTWIFQLYPEDFALYDRAVEENLHKYPALQKTRLNTLCC